MPRGTRKVQKAKDGLRQMRDQAGLYSTIYSEIITTIDWACKCLDNQSMTPEEADELRTKTLLNVHAEVQKATSQGAKDILKKLNDERCRIMNLYYAQENRLRGFTEYQDRIEQAERIHSAKIREQRKTNQRV